MKTLSTIWAVESTRDFNLGNLETIRSPSNIQVQRVDWMSDPHKLCQQSTWTMGIIKEGQDAEREQAKILKFIIPKS